MSIQEMKQGARAMPPDERAEFMAWLDEQYREDNQYRGQETDEYPGEAEEPEKPVTFDDIKHLAGIAKEGPSDLATNKRYLDDMGESSMQ